MKSSTKLLLATTLLLFSAAAQSARPPFQGVVTATLQPTWYNVPRKATVDDFLGRRTVLYFWTSSCTSCFNVWRELQQVAAKSDAPFQVIGVHSGRLPAEHDAAFVRSVIHKHELKNPIVDDADFTLWRVFGVTAWPSLVLINPEGQVVKNYTNVRTISELQKDVTALLPSMHVSKKGPGLPYRPEPQVHSNSPLRYPGRITLAEKFEGGTAFLVSDTGNHRIMVIRPNGSILYSIGSGKRGTQDGSFDQASFDLPSGIAYRDRMAYVAGTGNHLIRKIDFNKRTVETIAGKGTAEGPGVLLSSPALTTAIPSPLDVAFYPNDEELVIAVAGANQLWAYRSRTKVLRSVAGGSVEGMDDGMSSRITLAQPSALFPYEGQLFFIDSNSSSLRFFEKGRVTTLIGQALMAHGFENGEQSEALMQYPTSLWVDADKIYIADSYNHSIRVFDRKKNMLSTLAGRKPGKTNGGFLQAQFDNPTGLIRYEDNLYVSDSNNHSIRVLNLKRHEVSTLNLTPASVASRQAASVWEVAPQKEWKVALDLEKGWKLQTKKGSRFVLTQDAKPRSKTLYRANGTDLSKTLFQLPALSAEGKYRLQATFYFCSEGRDSLCTAHTVDSLIVPSTTGQSKFSIALRP